MTTRFGIATFAAATSAVLVFGNTAHAEEHAFLGIPPSLSTIDKISDYKPIQPTPTELGPMALPQQPSKLKKKKFEQLQEPTAIATETEAPAIIWHPVTDPSNNYIWGQCTWYAKSKRPDLPNGLGNGGQWVANAAARGFATGTVPRAGAIGEQPGHVVYVESVNGDGTVNISEMNYNGGVGVVHTRTVAASTFKYIY